MKDPYSILGIPRTATDDEVKTAYRNLARKYHPDNYADDNPLKDLAKEKMQEINNAYDEIQRSRAAGKSSSSGTTGAGSGSAGSFYNEVRAKIQKKHFRDAESMLMGVNEYDRVAEWHFLMSICLVQRGRPNDAMRELEIACSMDPGNMEYQQAKEMFNNQAAGYGSTYYGSNAYGYRRTDADRACDCCTDLICLDCLCECMGGDLIRCI